jgi:hypothetical protein
LHPSSGVEAVNQSGESKPPISQSKKKRNQSKNAKRNAAEKIRGQKRQKARLVVWYQHREEEAEQILLPAVNMDREPEKGYSGKKRIKMTHVTSDHHETITGGDS